MWPVEKASAVSMVSHKEFLMVTAARGAQISGVASRSAALPEQRRTQISQGGCREA